MRAAVRLLDRQYMALLCLGAFAVTGGLLAPAASGQAGVGGFRAGRSAAQRLCRQFSDYDHNGDGTIEIERLRLIDSSKALTEGEHEPGTVLVLVEPRLLRAGDS